MQRYLRPRNQHRNLTYVGTSKAYSLTSILSMNLQIFNFHGKRGGEGEGRFIKKTFGDLKNIIYGILVGTCRAVWRMG